MTDCGDGTEIAKSGDPTTGLRRLSGACRARNRRRRHRNRHPLLMLRCCTGPGSGMEARKNAGKAARRQSERPLVSEMITSNSSASTALSRCSRSGRPCWTACWPTGRCQRTPAGRRSLGLQRASGRRLLRPHAVLQASSTASGTVTSPRRHRPAPGADQHRGPQVADRLRGNIAAGRTAS